MAATSFGYESLVVVAIQPKRDSEGRLETDANYDEYDQGVSWSTPVASSTSLLPVVYEASADTIKRVTEPTTPTRLHGNTSPVKNVQGMVRAEGDLTLYIHETDLGFWIRQMLNTEASEVETESNLPTDDTVRASATYTGGTAIFDSTTTVPTADQPEALLTSPVVSGKLYVTFGTSGATPVARTITLRGRDHTEERLSESISFTPKSAEDIISASSYTNNVNQIDSSTPSSTEPEYGRLSFTFSGTNTVTASATATLDVRGISTTGQRIGETITLGTSVSSTSYITKNVYARTSDITYQVFDSSGGDLAVSMTGDVVTTSYHYKTLSYLLISANATGETAEVKVNPESYAHTIPLSSRVLDGLTMEIAKGEVPNTYHGMVVSSGTLTLAESVTLALTMLGRDGDLYYNIDGGEDLTSVTPFRRPGAQVASDWGMAVQFDLNNTGTFEAFSVSDASFTYNNNIDFPEARFRGERQYEKPVRKGDREVSISCTIDYEKNENFSARALGDEFGMKLIVANKPKGGTYNGLSFNMDVAELVGFTDPDVPDQTEILQTVEARAFSKTTTGEDEVEVVLYTTDVEVL